MANPNVQNHGGPVIGSVEVVPIIWGSQWPYDGSNNFPAQLHSFLQFYVGPDSTMMTMLREYSTPTTQITPGSVFGSTPITIQSNPPAMLTDAQVQSALQSWIGQTPNFPQPNANRLYVICLPHLTSVTLGQKVTCVNMAGYHLFTGSELYIVLPCCPGPTLPASRVFDALTTRLSHELCEAITDPRINAWTDNATADEIGDICSIGGGYPQFAHSPVGVVTTPSGGAFMVQSMWSQAQQNCVFGTAIRMTSLQLPGSVTGGQPVAGTVILNIPLPALPAGGTTINLTTDHPAVLQFNSPVTIPAGKRGAGIHGTTTPVSVLTAVIVKATWGAQSIEQMIAVLPPLKIAEFKYTPGSAPGFQTPPNAPQGTLQLNEPAPAGGVTINIFSNDPQIATPEPDVISIPAGAVSPVEKFYLQVTPVGVQTPVVLTASMTGSSAMFTFQVLAGGPQIIIVKSLRIHPQSVIGGATVFADFTLASAVGPAGGFINVTSSDTSIATVVSPVHVDANTSSGNFEITTKPLQQGTAHKSCTINAFENGPNLAFALLTVTS